MSLVPETPTEDLQSFTSLVGIRIVHVPVQRTAPISSALQSSLITALNACIDLDNHPVYLHCLDGRRITSMVVLLLRRLQGWLPMSALNEYWRFQSLSRSPSISLAEVEKNVREAENFASEVSSEVTVPENIPIWLWSGNRAVSKIQGVKLKHCPPLPEETTPSSELENQEAESGKVGQQSEAKQEEHSEEWAQADQQPPPHQLATDMQHQKQESGDLESQQVQLDHQMLTTPVTDESNQDQSEKRQEYEQELEQQRQQQQQPSQVQPMPPPQQVSRAISALDLHGLETSRVVKKKNGQS